MDEKITNIVIKTVLEHYPTVQGIYLYGSFGTEDKWPDSDVDIANHLIKTNKLGLPQDSKGNFSLLERANLFPGT